MNSFTRAVSLVAFVGVVLVVARLPAEIPPLKPAQRAADAKLIVSVTIKAVYSYEHELRKGFVDTRYVVEATVDSVDKGADLKTGDLVYVRLWETKDRPEGWAGPGGHSAFTGGQRVWPSDFKRGQRVQFFLSREEDRGLDALSPNGFEVLDKTAASKEDPQKTGR